MRPTTTLHIPQPCAENWDAMSPTATGRHCAACAKTVVDFTLKTDAEILAYLAGAATGRTCGRFAAGQLERPLQRAAPAAPSRHWRAWLAATVALWAVREGIGTEAKAQAATEWRARYWGGPVPAAPVGETLPTGAATTLTAPSQPSSTYQEALHGVPAIQNFPEHLELLRVTPWVVRGVVIDAANNEGVPGVTVLLKGTEVGVSTQADGTYEITLPAELVQTPIVTLVISSVGYLSQERPLATRMADAKQNFQLNADTRMLGEVVICQLSPGKLPPAPWHPRAFYYWSKYWLTRPFRRN